MKQSLCLSLLATACAHAAVIECKTCSQDDFEVAVYQKAKPGDTIVLPEGAATWGNSARNNKGAVYLADNITVQGQGDKTVITLDDSGNTYAGGVICVWSGSTFKDVKIIGSGKRPVTAFHIAPYKASTGGFRISNVTYEGGASGAYFLYTQGGVTHGLIDNCRLTGNSQQAELIFGRGPTNAWQTPNTLGTENNIFIEDCVFNNFGYVCDANSNARFVVRYCTMNGIHKVDGHGRASNSPPRGVRNMEVYGNTWTKTGSGFWANIEMRGGTGMIFDNKCETGWALLTEYAYNASPRPWPNFGYSGPTLTHGNPTTITTNVPHGYKTGWPVWVQAPLGVVYGYYNITVTGPKTFTIPKETMADERADFATTFKTPLDYPIGDQIGVGRDPAVGGSEPMYLWNNTKAGALWQRSVWKPSAEALAFYRAQTGDPSATFTERDIVRANRDFFASEGFDTHVGVSVGTKAQMQAMTPPKPNVVGYGFWVTDQGDWKEGSPGKSGVLYSWNGTAWVLRYTPYTYPHPARMAAVVPAVVAPASPRKTGK